MHVTVDQASLLAVLRRAATCASSTSTQIDHRLLRLATLKNAAGEDALAVGATDHILAYRGFVDGPDAAVVVREPGLLLLDAKDIIGRVDRMPEGRITIRKATGKTATFPNGNLRVQITHAEAKLSYTTAALPEKGLAPIRWPDKSQAKSLADLSGETLARLVTRAAWAAEPSDADPTLNALVLTVDRDQVQLAAGTTRSIAVVTIPAGARATSYVEGAPWEGVLALKSAKALLSFAQSAGPAVVSLTASPSMLVAECGGARLGCQLLAVAMRDYLGILRIVTRGTATQEIVVPKKALVAAIAATRAAIATSSDNPGLYLAAHGGHVHLVAEGLGDARDAVATATPITRSMVGQYLPSELDEAVKACGGDDVSLLFCEAMGTPLLVTDVHAGLSLSAVVIGMVKYRSRYLDALIAGTLPAEAAP